jgi:hypothetical protein
MPARSEIFLRNGYFLLVPRSVIGGDSMPAQVDDLVQKQRIASVITQLFVATDSGTGRGYVSASTTRFSWT